MKLLKSSYPTPVQKLIHWSSITPNRIFLHQPVNGKTITFTFTYCQVDDQATACGCHFLPI